MVSLVPSITETLLGWGVTPVAVTRFCEAEGITTVGGTKNPDVQAIASMHPDLVLMDEEENRAEDAEQLRASGVTVHATRVRSLTDAAEAVAAVAELVGVDAPGGALAVIQRSPPMLSAWVPIWRRPWMTVNGDTYGSDLLAAAGFENVFAADDDRYPTVGIGDVAGRKPDVVLAPSEPYRFSERHRSELEQVAPVEFVDGRDLFWWGIRTGGALARLRALAVRLAGR